MEALDAKIRDLEARREALKATGTAAETRNEDDPSQPFYSECKAIFYNWCEQGGWSHHELRHTYHNIVGLQGSALEGCPVYALLLRRLNDDTIQELLQKRPHFEALVTVDLVLAMI